MNKIGRHVTFYHIGLNDRGMARIEFLRHLVFDLDIHELLASDVLLLDRKTVRLQVPDPR